MDQTKEGPYAYRWVILGVLWITYIVVFLHRFSVGPLAPFFKKELELSSAQAGLLVSAGAFQNCKLLQMDENSLNVKRSISAKCKNSRPRQGSYFSILLI